MNDLATALLQPYCSTDASDGFMTALFTTEGHTWATNRWVLIRAENIPGIPETDDRRGMMLARHWQNTFREVAMQPASALRLPHTALTEINGIRFDTKALRLIKRLPQAMIEKAPEPDRPLSFTFEGGKGILQAGRHRKEPGF
jgi:hypothetical protein